MRQIVNAGGAFGHNRVLRIRVIGRTMVKEGSRMLSQEISKCVGGWLRSVEC